VPDDPELASVVCDEAELAEHEWHAKFEAEASSILHGQAPGIQANRVTRDGKPFQYVVPEVEAFERVKRDMREAARLSQLSGLRRPAVDVIPF
jgi:predicted nucleotidyltransferase